MTDNSANNKRVAKNTLYLFFRMIIVMAVSLYTSRVILDTLGVEDYGTYNVVGGVVVLFSFLRQAMNNATYRYLAYALGEGDENKLHKMFVMALNSHFLIATIILLLSETIGLWLINYYLVFPEGRLLAANIAYQFSIITFCVSILQTPYNSCILAHEEMSFFAVTSIWEVALKLGVVFLLLYIPGDNLVNYSWLLSVVALFLFIWYWIYCNKRYEECHYIRFWDSVLIKKLLQYSGWSIVVNGTDILVAQSCVMFFNVFFGVAANAALGLANNVTSQLYQFLQSFTQAYNPQIIKSYAKGDYEYFHKLIYSTSKLSYFLLFIVSVPILMNVDYILSIWLVSVPDDTGLFLVLVVLVSLVDAFSQPQWNAVHATGNLRTHQILMASIKILNIPFAYILLKLGCEAWSVLALKVLLNILCAIVRSLYMKRLIGLSMKKLINSVVIPIALVTIITLPVPLYLCNIMCNGILRLLVTSLTFMLTMGIACFVFGMTRQEKNLMLNVIRNKIPSRLFPDENKQS